MEQKELVAYDVQDQRQLSPKELITEAVRNHRRPELSLILDDGLLGKKEVSRMQEESNVVGNNPKFIHAMCGGEDVLVPEDISAEELLYTLLSRAMEYEIASLKYPMSSKRRSQSYSFILECFDRLKELSPYSQQARR